MRTIFEDLEEKANLEESVRGGNKDLPIILWVVALVFLVGTWGVYRWVANRPAPEPPPPPVSLEDPKQTSALIGQFNHFAQDGNWAEAEKLLSTAAQQKLKTDQKSLREIVLGDRKDDRVVEAATTPSIDRSEPGRFKQDCVYKFIDGQYKIVTFGLIIENGKMVIDSSGEEKKS